MHREFRELLHSAEGKSRRVVVIFLDVRGFSSFAGIAESTDTAEFLKSIYLKILDNFFPDAVFFKPTGDGLLILLDYSRATLTDTVRLAAQKSIQLVEAFPEMCEDDPMINFDVPTKLGIGLARGSATMLTADQRVLDYSGRPLNLAARLMDLARPSGVVFDDSYDYALLPDKLQLRFVKEYAYVKGIAEEDPLDVYALKGYTEIPEQNKFPMNKFTRFSEPTEEITFKELEDRAPVYRHGLSQEPAEKGTIKVHLAYPMVQKNGRKHPSLFRLPVLPATYFNAAGAHFAVVDYADKVTAIRASGVKGSWKVKLTLEYSVVDGADRA